MVWTMLSDSNDLVEDVARELKLEKEEDAEGDAEEAAEAGIELAGVGQTEQSRGLATAKLWFSPSFGARAAEEGDADGGGEIDIFCKEDRDDHLRVPTTTTL